MVPGRFRDRGPIAIAIRDRSRRCPRCRSAARLGARRQEEIGSTVLSHRLDSLGVDRTRCCRHHSARSPRGRSSRGRSPACARACTADPVATTRDVLRVERRQRFAAPVVRKSISTPGVPIRGRPTVGGCAPTRCSRCASISGACPIEYDQSGNVPPASAPGGPDRSNGECCGARRQQPSRVPSRGELGHARHERRAPRQAGHRRVDAELSRDLTPLLARCSRISRMPAPAKAPEGCFGPS